MRDTYILIIFFMFILSGTFLAFSGKVEPQLVMVPLVTGFLGLLAQVPKPPDPNASSFTIKTHRPTEIPLHKDDKS